jgi:hypothetical protein
MGVARILGFNFSGFLACWMWRTIYLSKLPGLDKKVRVAFDWTLDLLFPKDICAIYDLNQHSPGSQPNGAHEISMDTSNSNETQVPAFSGNGAAKIEVCERR